MPNTIHHVFPYNPAHLGMRPDAWVESQIARWPLASVKVAGDTRRVVHFITNCDFRANAGGLEFFGHRARFSGPNWRDWGDDWSVSLERTLRSLRSSDHCVLHLDTYPTAVRAHSCLTECTVSIVLHGRGFPGAHVFAADLVIGIRQDVVGEMIQRGFPEDRLILTRPSIDTSIFCPNDYKQSDKLRLGFVGTIAPSKGTNEVLECIELLAKAGKPFSLEMAGTGIQSDVEYLKAQVSKLGLEASVHLLGHVSSPRIAGLMKTWHAMLHPSYSEGMPIVVLEALATNCPIIVVKGVLPLEMESQQGVSAFDRHSFASSFLELLPEIELTNCSRDLVLDHSVGAKLWSLLDRLQHRKISIARPYGWARYWRLKPIRRLVQTQPKLRKLIRQVRSRMGVYGGLQ